VHAQLTSEFAALCERASSALRAVRAKRVDSIPPSARRVLVVDDDLAFCRSAVRMLGALDCGPEVEIASSVAMAHAKLSEQRFHVIVVDWQLANGHAGDVIRAARSARKNVWVVLCSGRLTPHDGPRMSRTLDADDWLAKPFPPEDLKYVVGKGLDKFEDPRGPTPTRRGTAPAKRVLGGDSFRPIARLGKKERN
jgi:CheY-like chemotaxis protein